MEKYITIQGGYRKYDEVTFLKGMSITTIVLMHLIKYYLDFLPDWVVKASSLGGTGVHVFFFCSGFGLYLSYLHRRISIVEFIKKRFLKLYIPYIIIVIISFFVPYFIVKGSRIGALLSHIFLYKMFIPKYESTFGPFWFISTLVQLYFVFFLLCKIKNVSNKHVFFIISLFLSIIWWVFTSITGLCDERTWASFFLQYLWEFSLGIIVAEYLYNKESININFIYIILICVIGFLLEGILGWIGGFGKVFNDIPALFGYGALGLLLYQIKLIKIIGNKISTISYEWYLIHILIFEVLFHISKSIGFIIFVVLLSLLISYLYNMMFTCINKKLLNMRTYV